MQSSSSSLSTSIRVATLAAAGCLSIAIIRALLAGTKKRRTSHTSSPLSIEIEKHFEEIKDAVAFRLAAALKFRTISYESSDGRPISLITGNSTSTSAPSSGCLHCKEITGSTSTSTSSSEATPAAIDDSRRAFLSLHDHLRVSFPLLHENLERHVVNNYSLLFIWRPLSSETLTPGIALCAHMDVVPVPDEKEWVHPPFDGVIAEGFVNGRGAIDDKHSLMSICESVEFLLSKGWKPSRCVLLCFGHDEELGGEDGARHFSKLISQLVPVPQNQRPLKWVLDEGLFLIRDVMPGITSRAAIVCTAEKGHVNVELSTSSNAGHSSIPPSSSSIGTLARGISILESSPYPTHLYPAMNLFKALLPSMPFLPRLLFANEWLFCWIIKKVLLSKPSTAAMIRTTTAVTIVGGGVKSNVMPPSARAIVNRRIHPSESVDYVLKRDEKALAAAGLEGIVSVSALEPLEPSPCSSTSSLGWTTISEALETTFKNDRPIQAPGLMLGNTDTRWFWTVADDIYRHTPTELTMAETAMFHGKNERVAIANLARMCIFYSHIIIFGQKD
jgi:carboxypeptidase PM20D1